MSILEQETELVASLGAVRKEMLGLVTKVKDKTATEGEKEKYRLLRKRAEHIRMHLNTLRESFGDESNGFVNYDADYPGRFSISYTPDHIDSRTRNYMEKM